jgi:hypothetical protein
MTQRDRIDPAPHQSALQLCVVLGEVRRAQHGRRQVSLLDHALGRELRVEVRYVAEVAAAVDGQVHDALHARLPRQAQRKQRASQLLGHDGAEHEDRAHPGQGGAHGVDVEKISPHRRHPVREVTPVRGSGQRPYRDAARHQALDHQRAHQPGCPGHQNCHRSFLL